MTFHGMTLDLKDLAQLVVALTGLATVLWGRKRSSDKEKAENEKDTTTGTEPD